LDICIETKTISQLDGNNISQRKQLFVDLKKVNLRIEMIEKQKIKGVGDINIKFFHRFIKWRRRKNIIKGVGVRNELCEEPKRVKEMVQNLYKNIFFEQPIPKVRLDNVVFLNINKEDNDLLVSSFSKEEIRAAI